MTVNTTELRAHFQREGFAIARHLFSLEETIAYRDHYMRLSAEGPHPNDLVNQWDDGEKDPLRQYPRLFNIHRWDEISRQWLLHERCARFDDCTVLYVLQYRPNFIRYKVKIDGLAGWHCTAAGAWLMAPGTGLC